MLRKHIKKPVIIVRLSRLKQLIYTQKTVSLHCIHMGESTANMFAITNQETHNAYYNRNISRVSLLNIQKA